MKLVRLSVLHTHTYDIPIKTQHIPDIENQFADASSRFQWTRLRMLAHLADLYPWKVPILGISLISISSCFHISLFTLLRFNKLLVLGICHVSLSENVIVVFIKISKTTLVLAHLCKFKILMIQYWCFNLCKRFQKFSGSPGVK